MSILRLGSATLARHTAGRRHHLLLLTRLVQESAIGPGSQQVKRLRTGIQSLLQGFLRSLSAILRANGVTRTGDRTRMNSQIVLGTGRGSMNGTVDYQIVKPRHLHGRRAKSVSAGARTRRRLRTCLRQHDRTSSVLSARDLQILIPMTGHTQGTTAPPGGIRPSTRRARTRAFAPAAPAQARCAGARRMTTCAHRSSAQGIVLIPRLAVEGTTLLRIATSLEARHPQTTRHACVRRRPRVVVGTTTTRGTIRVRGVIGTTSTRGTGTQDMCMTDASLLGGCRRLGLRRRMGDLPSGGTIGAIVSLRAVECTSV